MGAVGVVLAGGRSSRMGRSKASLPWHGTTLLDRTVRIVHRAVDGPVTVVRAPGQPLPTLPDDVEVVDDPQEGVGPLQGIAVGLAATQQRAELAFLCSTDLPLLHPAYVAAVLAAFDPATDAVVPHVHGHRQPLAAGYRTTLAATAARLLAEGSRKPAMLLDACRTRWLREDDLLADTRLARHDPGLRSVENVNTPEELAAAQAEPLPRIAVQRFGTLARTSGPSAPEHLASPDAVGTTSRTMVATPDLGAAADAVGVTLDRHVVAALNGERITRDRGLPLVAGDEVAFLSADAGG